ncbi:16499_t:CDS:2 [Funneliformis caledonium]|uniref:16499_t:CDS:1 n=1 Tax=Funneliformis caledonium TaxID=1117310 RepID=A0A9N8YNT6_9GLOM|nr:16499_t:CDS:2 [Funneliformis caledonium]
MVASALPAEAIEAFVIQVHDVHIDKDYSYAGVRFKNCIYEELLTPQKFESNRN